jgi:NitT/TauT family transport system ATP-binding protein
MGPAARRLDGPVIECVDAGIRYPGATPNEEYVAVQGLDLTIHAGEFITVVGASGCGKTTILYALDGLQPISDGTMRVNGADVTGPGPDRAVVFQEFGLLPWRSVVDNIALGLEGRGVSRAERRRIARDLADKVGLSRFVNAYPNQLSGGMKQRVGIARALAVEPEILLMDEPFGALDSQTREVMGEELLKIWSTTGKTVFFVTHDIDEAVYLADRIVVLSRSPGRVREIVPVDLPRPRLTSVRSSHEFQKIRSHVWGLLENEVRQAATAQ